MTITLNVLITLTGGEKVFSVWSEPVPAITGLDLAVAAGFTITDAVKTLFQALLGPFFVLFRYCFSTTKFLLVKI